MHPLFLRNITFFTLVLNRHLIREDIQFIEKTDLVVLKGRATIS